MLNNAPEIEYLVLDAGGFEIERLPAGERALAVFAARALSGKVIKLTHERREEIFNAAEQDEVFAR